MNVVNRDSSQARPRFELPRFSMWAMLAAVTTIAVYFGLLRWIGPLALYFAVAVWFVLILKQLDPEARAAARLAAQVWGGVAMPLTLLAFLFPQLARFGNGPANFLAMYGCWAGGVAAWLICQFANTPKLAALTAGYLPILGGMFALLGFLLPFGSDWFTSPADAYSRWEKVVCNFAVIFAFVFAGLVAAFTCFVMARQAWRKSHRNRAARLLALVGVWLAISGGGWFARWWL